MNDNSHAEGARLRKRNDEAPGVYCYSYTEGVPALESQGAAFVPGAGGPPQPASVSGWTVLDLLAQRWHWLVVGSFLCAGLFFLLGLWVVKPKYTANAQLLRYEPIGKSDYFRASTPISSDTFAAMLRAPELFRNVSERAFYQFGIPPVPPETFTKIIKIAPDPDSDMVKVSLAARNPEQAIHLLNLFLTNAVQYTRDLEAKQDAVLANEYLKKEVQQMNRDIAELQDQFRRLPINPMLSNALVRASGQIGAVGTRLSDSQIPTMLSFAEQAKRLQTAIGELNDLLLKYTDLHPLVQAKRAQVEILEQQVTSASANTNLQTGAFMASTGKPGDALNPDLDIIHIKLRALEDGRLDLVKRQREAEMYAANPLGSVRIFAHANLRTVQTNMRGIKVSLVAIVGALLGLGASLALVLLVEFMDNRLKSADDLHRVTRLPVLAALGDLREMSPEARSRWGFRAWTMLQGRLSLSPNHGLVCGVTSSTHGEGRSTWISLLAEAASATGFRVLTIATRPSPTHVTSTDENPEEPLSEDSEMNDFSSSHALTTNVLAAPAQVTEQLTGPNSQPVVHIPLPGWVWNLERRRQWREALNHWSQIDNLVIFVELPPANMPEAVLLGANLPNMIWLAGSGEAHAAETRTQLETLRDARCRLAGAVLNRESAPSVRTRFPRWLNCVALLLALGAASARAQDTNAAPAPGASEVSPATPTPVESVATPTNHSFSIIDPSQRAEWQKRLTLGPGDVLTFNLYGQPEVAHAEVAVAPDGRVSFLEAQDIMASGLTIDELRAKIDQALVLYRRAPHTIITPVAYRSKKYYMLGMVTTKGVFTLDRPLTVLEALARAHGLESALVDRNVLDLADFSHSFLVRGGKRYPLNFERLFQQGDLSQNIAIEPNDYIYFAPGDIQQVYVVGEVRIPGPVTYTPDLTIISAIAARGGYTQRAFKMRVLVVRGSLSHPEAIVVNTHAILDAKALNFKLRPKDIVFVNSRPFIRVEEAADLAATAFIQSVVNSWVGVDVLKPF